VRRGEQYPYGGLTAIVVPLHALPATFTSAITAVFVVSATPP
jgi:hypothetical protein